MKYTTIPSPVMGKLEPWLKEHKIEYEVYWGSAVPDNVPTICTFRGREYTNTVSILSPIEPKELTEICEGFYSPNKKR